ncbi:MAG: tetratricopeptide repeat protein, partial [Fuerstiella sp.]|nr:tetratricopeptide repeat protein [Fuerstiella sp.]
QVLRTIINIHRKALKTAVADKRSDDLIGQLQQVFGNDTEFLSDQLFARGEYKESATLRNEVEQFYQDLLGQQHNSTRLMHWKAVTAEKLSIASKDKKTAYVVATGAETQAQHALRDGQLDVAAEVYTQLIDAQIAVLGEAHPDVAVDLNEFGRVLWMQEKHGQAESVYQRSLRAREATTER